MLAAPLFGVYSFGAYFHISTWMGCKSAKIMVLQIHKNLKGEVQLKVSSTAYSAGHFLFNKLQKSGKGNRLVTRQRTN
jgi:hypothetical protein